jgi:hypothetical protein
LRIEAPEVTRAAQRKHDPRVPRRLAPYVAVNLVLAIVGTTYLMFTEFTMALPGQIALAAFLLLTMLSWGGLMEERRWAAPVEFGRLVLGGAVAAAWFARGNAPAAALCIAFALVLGVWFVKARAAVSPAAAAT